MTAPGGPAEAPEPTAAPAPAPPAGRAAEPLRFLVAGAVNTGTSLGAYWLLLLALPYAPAYVLSFLVGALVSFTLNTYFVFRVPWSWPKLLAFPGVQVINLLFGLFLLWVLVDGLGVADTIAPLIQIPLAIPLNFVLTRWLMRRGSGAPAPTA